MSEKLDSIVSKLKGVSGQLSVINGFLEDSEAADAIWATNDYLNTIIEELATLTEE